MALDFSDLQGKVDALVAVIPAIRADYTALFQAIADLKSQLDPAAQAKIDELTAKLGESVDALGTIDASYPPAPVA